MLELSERCVARDVLHVAHTIASPLRALARVFVRARDDSLATRTALIVTVHFEISLLESAQYIL